MMRHGCMVVLLYCYFVIWLFGYLVIWLFGYLSNKKFQRL
jgi:hypothetical protein